MTKVKKILAIVLTVTTLLSVFSVATPIVAVAANEKNEQATTETIQSNTSEVKEAVIIGEDESRRTANQKHFIMSDGSRKAIIYSNPVHFNNNGKWQEIDNTLVYNKDTEVYENKSNKFNAKFGEKFNNENLFSIESEGYTISWEYAEDSFLKKFVNAEYKTKEPSTNEILSYYDKTEDKIYYDNFKSGCRLEYVVVNNGVKENIILSNKNTSSEFTFNIKANNLVLSENADGSISAKNKENNEIFYIPAPFMYDSNNIYSYDVSYTLTGSNGSYTLKITADKTWLESSDRAYPVTIDPIIYTKQAKDTVSSTFVASGKPGENFGSQRDVYIGVESANYLKCHALFKTDLPTLNKGDMVIGANLNLCMYSTSFIGNNTRQLDAHIITSAWEENSVTWSTKPTYNSVITDYNFMRDGEVEWKSFDITKAVKNWYEGTIVNNGILIKSHDETLDAARAIFWSENANDQSQYYPFISIDYRNNKGTESYWSYSNFSAGIAGVSSINDYTGNLVHTIPLASTVSNVMPVSLSLVYNSYSSANIYTAGKNGSNITSGGKGWKLNVQQTLLPSTNYGLTGEAAANYPYVYTDADGTEHYIAKTTNEDGNIVYKDEDGLGYTYTRPSTSIAEYKLTKDDGSFMYFNAKGNLTNIYDNSLNKITLEYNSDGTKLLKVTDGTNHYFKISYYRNSTDTADTNFIHSITDNAGRVVTLAIQDSVLNGVIFYDNENKAYIRYTKGVNNDDDNLIDYVWSTDKNGLAFTYVSKTRGSRVNRVSEFSADSLANAVAQNRETGAIINFDRSLYNTTVIRSPGIDGINGEVTSGYGNDDILTTLQFDNMGRTVSQQVKYGNGESVGAGTYSYTGAEEIESRNRIASSATINKNTANAITNVSGELNTGWSVFTSGGLTGGYEYSTAESYYGKKSLKLTASSVTSVGRNCAYQATTKLTPGYYYTFSAYVKITDITLSNFVADTLGVYLRMSALDAEGNYLLTKYSQILTEKTDEEINNGWRRIYVTMQVPQNTTKVSLYMFLGSSVGTVYFDGMQLEQGVAPSSVNLLENSSFEKYTSNGITNWTPTEDVTYTAGTNGITTEVNKDGSAALKFIGDANTAKGFYQLVPVNGNENDTYIVSGWAAAYAVNHTFHEDSKFEIAARVTYKCSDNTTVTQYKKSAIFNTTIADWQYASSAFSLKYENADTNDTKTYTPTHIMVMPRYNYQANHVYFDHIQLIKDVAQTYIYDSEGNVTSVSANAEQKSDMTYDGDDLKTYTDALGNTTEYTYDANHHLLQAKTPKGVTTNYTYNSKGLVTTTTVESATDSSKMQTSQTYSPASSGVTAGAYLYKTTNELGKVTTYGHNLPTGVQTSVEDANTNKTTYGYNETYTKLEKTLSDSTSVDYTYDGNRVSSISFGYGADTTYEENYSFVYDNFGNVLKTKVGETSLATNIYGANNGLLEKSTYANGDAIRYNYAKSGLVTSIYQDNDTQSNYAAYTWLYSANGTPYIHKDGYSGLKYDYSYDSIGRLIRTDISNSTSSAFVGSTEYGYDVRNNLTSITNKIGGVSFEQIYSYSELTGIAGSLANSKDNLPTRYVALGINTDYSYNGLNQLTSKSVGASGNPITNQYYYNTRTTDTATFATNQLRCEVIEGVSYHYNYDDVGNITSIGIGSGESASPANYKAYQYDKLNRLEKETQYNNKRVILYEYNHLGNIVKKTIQTYTTDDLTDTPITNEITYNYGNDNKSGWNYLLTSYDENSDGIVDDNEKISYDSIGNPLTYRGATLSWYGRQMRSFAKNGVTSTMTYDADGLRSSKTVNGAKTTYQYIGDKLFYESRGDGNSFYYFYDSYGNLSAIYHYVNGTRVPYHVTTNSQGDVIALYSWDGALVATYEYDAWGNCTITQDTSSTGIATLNPMRYRGYYYDKDLGLYYLQSRYYDATIGRFLNSDNITDPCSGLMGFNTFLYCGNNPVMYIDPTGHSVLGALFGASIITSFLVELGKILIVVGCVGLGTILGYGFGVAIEEAHQTYTFKTDAAIAADEKIRDTIKPGSPDRYWKANRINDIVTIAEPISFEEAVSEVSAGRNVFAVTSEEAYAVALAAGGNAEPMFHMKKNKTNHYNHYHVHNHENSAHVWYLF